MFSGHGFILDTDTVGPQARMLQGDAHKPPLSLVIKKGILIQVPRLCRLRLTAPFDYAPSVAQRVASTRQDQAIEKNRALVHLSVTVGVFIIFFQAESPPPPV